MSQIELHFAFPDAALVYDCASCDQRCCKTGSLAVFPRERERLVRHHPALELVAPSLGGDISLFATPCSGCWFLDGKKCSLRGGGLEPYACQLFPFNLFGRHGNTLVVAPHPLCPLRVAPGEGQKHSALLELIGKIGAAGAPPVPVRERDPKGALGLERVIREGATTGTQHDTPFPFLGFTALTTQVFLKGGLRALDRVDLSGVHDAADEMARLAERYAAITLTPWPNAEAFARVTPTLAAWTPSLRLFSFDDLSLALLPKAFAALSLFAAHWAALRPDRAVLPQALAQMTNALGPTLRLLARWDEPWHGAPVESLGIAKGASLVAIEPRLAGDLLERTWQLRTLADARASA